MVEIQLNSPVLQSFVNRAVISITTKVHHVRRDLVPNLIEVPLESGGSILIEADGASSGDVLRGKGATQVIEQVSQTLEKALGHVRSTANAVIAQLRAIPQTPDEVSVEFGVRFGAKGN